MQKSVIITGLIIILSSVCLYSEEIDLTAYYKFPVSVGAEYQSISHITGFQTGAPYSSLELSGNIRLPFKNSPWFQPMLKAGYLSFDSNSAASTEKWDHYCYFGELGALLTNRFNSNFEFGFFLLGGYGYSIFENLDDSPLSSQRILAETGVKLSLVPSYNLCIDFSPVVKYFHGLENYFTDFNGLSVGFGVSGSFRFGEDPDSNGNIIRSLQISPTVDGPLFAALQSYYTNNPFGRVVITNTDKKKVENIEVSFFQQGYSDSPSPVTVIDELPPGETAEIDLTANFNSNIFLTEGITPLTAELIFSYTVGNKPAEQRKSLNYDLYDKRSLIWDDDRKVASFITPADTALQNYTSYIKTTCKDLNLEMYNQYFQSALQVFEALKIIGVIYQSDPTAPFSSVKGDSMIVDTVNLPRMTLQKSTGDCDDLTVLYCTLLETLGIETAIITVPGHIFMAFNTSANGREYSKFHYDRAMTINIDNELWIPVEITMLGKKSFLEAWIKGAEEWNSFEGSENRAIHLISDCRNIYRPVGLLQTDLGLQYGSAEDLKFSVQEVLNKHISSLDSVYRETAEKSGKPKDFNKLGIFYAGFEQYNKAIESFLKSLSIDSEYLSTYINLGNVYFLKNDFNKALSEYSNAEKIIENKNRQNSSASVKLRLNISKTYQALENHESARKYYDEAIALNPEIAESFSFAGTPTAENASRAAESQDQLIIFIDEE